MKITALLLSGFVNSVILLRFLLLFDGLYFFLLDGFQIFLVGLLVMTFNFLLLEFNLFNNRV